MGKQGWKFLTEPTALTIRVFKEKYFSKGNFLSATIGYRPSYVWKTIHAAQNVMRDGFKWRLEDGSLINIWSEPWLRDDVNCFVETTPSLQLCELTVQDLVVPNLKIWGEDLIYQIFFPEMCRSFSRCDHLLVKATTLAFGGMRKRVTFQFDQLTRWPQKRLEQLVFIIRTGRGAVYGI
ncbi:hypothetical protein LINPERPRIM_LOCUS38107 [Linum perenne]